MRAQICQTKKPNQIKVMRSLLVILLYLVFCSLLNIKMKKQVNKQSTDSHCYPTTLKEMYKFISEDLECEHNKEQIISKVHHYLKYL